MLLRCQLLLLSTSNDVYIRQKQPSREVLKKRGVLKICSKFSGEYPCWRAISIKLLCSFIEIALRYGCSPENLQHILRTPFPKNISGRLLLYKTKKCFLYSCKTYLYFTMLLWSSQFCFWFKKKCLAFTLEK